MHILYSGLLSWANSIAISLWYWKLVRKGSREMKQLWLINPPTVSESTITSELESHTHGEIIALMAAAIEAMRLQKANEPQQVKEASADESITAASQD
jgi:hypothetical protein